MADMTWHLQETCALLVRQVVARQDAQDTEDLHVHSWTEPSVSGNFNAGLNKKDQFPVLLTSSLKQALHAEPQAALDRLHWHCSFCPSTKT